MNTRKLAATTVTQVIGGESLATALPKALAQAKTSTDKAFIKNLSYGTCRWYFVLEKLLAKLLKNPIKHKDQDIKSILLIGLFQLRFTSITPFAAVNETVAAVSPKKPWAKKLVNAILRNYLRETPKTQHNGHPEWLTKKITKAWPNDANKIFQANNQHPPFCLRVNQQKVTQKNYLKKLTELGIKAEPIPNTKNGIKLEIATETNKLPGFKDGLSSVQDGAAQLAAPLLAPRPNDKILDACAAPGGKTTHLLELQPSLGELTALDKKKDRLEKIQQNLDRLNLSCKLIQADATNVNGWWNGTPFDRILLDAPCSASGVIRRHPDIRLLRKEQDIANLACQQYTILTALWQTLSTGGLLLYATCSVFPEENTEIIKQFLATHNNAKEIKIDAPWGISCAYGRQILPGDTDMDGFYYALLEKTPSNG